MCGRGKRVSLESSTIHRSLCVFRYDCLKPAQSEARQVALYTFLQAVETGGNLIGLHFKYWNKLLQT